MSSNRDPIVTWVESLALGNLLPHSELAMFYGLAHPMKIIPVLPVARAIANWVERVGKK